MINLTKSIKSILTNQLVVSVIYSTFYQKEAAGNMTLQVGANVGTVSAHCTSIHECFICLIC